MTKESKSWPFYVDLQAKMVGKKSTEKSKKVAISTPSPFKFSRSLVGKASSQKNDDFEF